MVGRSSAVNRSPPGGVISAIRIAARPDWRHFNRLIEIGGVGFRCLHPLAEARSHWDRSSLAAFLANRQSLVYPLGPPVDHCLGQPATPRRCRSSVVEHSLGKGEGVSSILTGSTILINDLYDDKGQLDRPSV